MRTQRKERAEEGVGGARAALGEWQAQSLGDSAGAWRNPEERVVQDDPGDLQEMVTGWDKEQGCWEHLPGVSPAVGLGPFQLPGHYLPRQRGPCHSRASGSWRRPGGSCSGSRALSALGGGRESHCQSSAPDTRWLRASARFSKTNRRGLPLFSRMVGSAVPVLCWVCGQPWLTGGRASGHRPRGHGTAPRAGDPSEQLPGEARRRPGAAPMGGRPLVRSLTGGPVGAQPCVLCHLGLRHCRVHAGGEAGGGPCLGFFLF